MSRTLFILLVMPHWFALGHSLEVNLLACREITMDAQRLRCLDNAIAELPAAELSINEKSENIQKPTNTQSPLGEKYIQQKNNSNKKEQSFSLLKAYKNRQKQWVFELDNGQHWQQNEARYLPTPKAFPVQVTISEGLFGAFNLKADYLNKTVKVKRIH